MKVSFSRSSAKAATLVELVLALGILAVAMVSLLGMLTRGVGTMKKAADLATESRIVQQLIDEVQATDWDRLDAVVAEASFQTRYFDDQGIITSRGRQIYTTRIYLDQSPDDTGPAFGLPGDEAVGVDRKSDLRRVIVRITHVPGNRGEAMLDSPGARASYREFFGTVIRLRGEENRTGEEAGE